VGTSTAYKIIDSAWRLLNSVDDTEELSPSQAELGLASLNDMLEVWRIDGLLTWAKVGNTFAAVSGKASYSVGPGGEMSMVRPVAVRAVTTRLGTLDYPLQEISFQEWEQIRYKSIGSSIPRYYAYQPTDPLGELYIYPVPTGTDSITLITDVSIPAYSLYDVVILPPGYMEAIKFNLSIRFAGYDNKPVSPDVQRIAAEAVAALKRINATTGQLDVSMMGGDPAWNPISMFWM
jgi:hypothetical protein